MRSASQSSESSLVRYSQRVVVDRLDACPTATGSALDLLGGRRVQRHARLVAVRRARAGSPPRRRPGRRPGSVARLRSARPPARGRSSAVQRGTCASPRGRSPTPTRYQRLPEVDEAVRLDAAAASRCRRGCGRRSAGARGRGRRRRSTVSASGSTVGPLRGGSVAVAERSALTRRRRCDGQHLLELHERAHRRLLDPGHRRARGAAQADGDRDRLVVVQQQRRHRRARAQPVAAGRPGRGVDRIAELAQPLDVAADRRGRRPRAARRARRRASRARVCSSDEQLAAGGRRSRVMRRTDRQILRPDTGLNAP